MVKQYDGQTSRHNGLVFINPGLVRFMVGRGPTPIGIAMEDKRAADWPT